jgi:uracil phosphoribosyltransferase
VNTSSADFVFYSKRIARLLVEETLAELPSQQKDIQTPCGPFCGTCIPALDNDTICAVSIMRAGDSLVESVRECLPGVAVGKILIQRNEAHESKSAEHYYTKLPPRIGDKFVILCDPMLATGGSSSKAIEALEAAGVSPSKIIFANIITCPEGLAYLSKKHPDVKIVTACVDEKLNEHKYIVPGLGDFGDRFFNTT